MTCQAPATHHVAVGSGPDTTPAGSGGNHQQHSLEIFSVPCLAAPLRCDFVHPRKAPARELPSGENNGRAQMILSAQTNLECKSLRMPNVNVQEADEAGEAGQAVGCKRHGVFVCKIHTNSRNNQAQLCTRPSGHLHTRPNLKLPKAAMMSTPGQRLMLCLKLLPTGSCHSRVTRSSFVRILDEMSSYELPSYE